MAKRKQNFIFTITIHVVAANKAVGADELGQDVVQLAKRATDTISGEEVRD